MKKKSISFKLSFAFSLFIFFTVLLFSIISIIFLSNSLLQQKRDEITGSFSKLTPHSLRFYSFFQNKEKVPFPSDGGMRLMVESGIPYYVLFSLFAVDVQTKEMRLIATNDSFLPVLPLNDANKKPKVRRYEKKDYFIDGDLDVLYYSAPITTNKKETLYLQTGLNMEFDTTRAMLQRFIVIIALTAIPLLAFSFFAALYFSARLLKPVAKMTKTARQISVSSLNQRIHSEHNGDELSVLADTFNELFQRLENDFQRERRFTSDVSHELKTPLAVILGHTRLLTRWGKDDKKVLEESLATIQKESEAMNEMIENLLLLSRTESKANSSVTIKKQEIDCSKFFEKLKNDVEILNNKALVELQIEEDASFVADETILLQVARIIVSNSLKYTSENPHLIFGATQGRLFFQDFGYGIAQDDIPHIFDRFYRSDESRNKKTGGTGLGLAIAKNLLSLMDITISVESELGKGSKMILELADPLAMKN